MVVPAVPLVRSLRHRLGDGASRQTADAPWAVKGVRVGSSRMRMEREGGEPQRPRASGSLRHTWPGGVPARPGTVTEVRDVHSLTGIAARPKLVRRRGCDREGRRRSKASWRRNAKDVAASTSAAAEHGTTSNFLRCALRAENRQANFTRWKPNRAADGSEPGAG